jgi:hypothetical protein
MDGWQLALPFPPGKQTTSPEGLGVVSGAAETPSDWLVRVQLDGGGHWTGLAAELLPVYEAEERESTIEGGLQ